MNIKKSLLLASWLFMLTYSYAQNTQLNGIKYDSALAKRSGADARGMKRWVIGILTDGSVHISDSAENMRVQVALLKNIERMIDEGVLILAGPILGNQKPKGVLIFNVSSVPDAKKLMESDAAVKAGVFEIEYYPWFASAALTEIPRLHKSIQKIRISE
jgi:uncharacterized protein YciI